MTGVVYTASAQEDLLAAWLFIAERNPTAADRVLETIEEEAQMLGQHPLMGRARPELPHAVRSWATSTPFTFFICRVTMTSRCYGCCTMPVMW
ncbi:plasmid stabilization system protein [mine drainage metagenome]|uniref:Plasmid stabilization system protein n=1 Tax=mine drainage metagenome TaxID=410659 RepID=A0A1J5PJE9_9ZZZZ